MVFLGRFDGILVKPFFEQSTMAPSLAQVHWFGHDAFTKTGPDTIKIAAKIQKNCENRKENRTDFCIFSVQPSCFAMVVSFFNHNHSLHFYSLYWNNFFIPRRFHEIFHWFSNDFRSRVLNPFGLTSNFAVRKFNLLLTVNSNENTLKLNWLRVEYRGQSTVAAAAS